jgi:BirA family biotin operon repressor/biotin-[acetyl-CoA-carboxylase] ligase
MSLPTDLDPVAAAAGRFSDVRAIAEIDSTNTALLAAAARGAAGNTVLVADYQTAGRGRHGRTWEAAPGAALLCSVLLRSALPAASLPLLGLSAGVAMAEAIEVTTGVWVDLKWPNDLRLAGRKLGGILVEGRTQTSGVDAVVVGVGVNVRRGALPPDVAELAVSLEEEDALVGRTELLHAYLESFDARVTLLEADAAAGTAGLLDAYRLRCETIGRRIRARLDTDPVEGTATDIADDGALILHTDSGTQIRIEYGEITHLS